MTDDLKESLSEKTIVVAIGIVLLLYAIVIASAVLGRVEAAPQVCKNMYGSVVPCP